MAGDEINMAVGAEREEAGQPRQTRGWAAVGYGRRAQLGFAGKWLHVGHIAAGCRVAVQVRLACVVWLVEAEEVGAAAGNGRLSGLCPAVRVISAKAPEHGDILKGRVEAGCGRSPVVGPRDERGANEATA